MLSLLIIDDDIDDVQLITDAVSEVAPSVRCDSASGSEDALRKLRNGDDKIPDLIFLDLNMPGVNGKECLREIKRTEKLSNIPVIIYSTSSFQKDIDEAKYLGASYFLTKPSSFRELCKALSEIIGGEF